MSTARARSVATLVDDAVVSVHRKIGPTHGERIRSGLDQLGLESGALMFDVTEFLLADAFSLEVMGLRFRYHDPADLDRTISSWLVSGVIDRDLRATPGLQRLLRLVLELRADVAQNIWREKVEVFPEVLVGAAAVMRASDGPLTVRFRRLPVPDNDALAVHHLLTGVRYHRADAHAAAWQEAGLNREEIRALTDAWHGKTVEPLSSLVERGWFDRNGLTESGGRARDEIEVVTNQHAGDAFDVLDDEAWLAWFDAVRSLATSQTQSL